MDIGWSEDDLEAWSDGEAWGGLGGAAVGGGIVWWVGLPAAGAAGPVIFTAAAAATTIAGLAIVGSFVGALIEGDDNGDGKVDTEEEKIEALD